MIEAEYEFCPVLQYSPLYPMSIVRKGIPLRKVLFCKLTFPEFPESPLFDGDRPVGEFIAAQTMHAIGGEGKTVTSIINRQ